ncbi:MAG: hypothetical protein WAN12_14045 [Candidatus Acidiferrum sp.]
MKNPSDWELSEASRAYGVANTPLFLVRKLQADPEVRAICDACSGEQILDALESALRVEPATPAEQVRPYAFLVALWFKPTADHLREAFRFSCADTSWRWFGYIAAALLETFSHVESQTIQVPARIGTPSASTQPAATIARMIIAP